MIFVVAKHRCSEVGISSWLMVKHSSRPSSRLAAASGYSGSNYSATFFSLAMPVLASRRQAARIAYFTCDFW